MSITRDNVLVFKAIADDYLYELGEPPMSLAEAMIGFERAARALAMATKEARSQRGAPKGFDAMPRPKLRVV